MVTQIDIAKTYEHIEWEELDSASDEPPSENALVRIFKSAVSIFVAPDAVYAEYGNRPKGEYNERRYTDRVCGNWTLEQVEHAERASRPSNYRNSRPIKFMLA